MKKLFVFASAILMAVAVHADYSFNMADFTLNGDPDYVEAAENGGVVTVSYDLGAWAAGGVTYALPDGEEFEGIELQAKLNGSCEEGQWLAFMVYLTDEDGVSYFDDAPDLHLNDERFADWHSLEAYNNEETGNAKYMPTREMWPAEGQDPKPFSEHSKLVSLSVIANPMLAEVNSFSIKELVLRQGGTGLNEMKAAKASAKRVIKNGRFMIQFENGRYINALGADL